MFLYDVSVDPDYNSMSRVEKVGSYGTGANINGSNQTEIINYYRAVSPFICRLYMNV